MFFFFAGDSDFNKKLRNPQRSPAVLSADSSRFAKSKLEKSVGICQVASGHESSKHRHLHVFPQLDDSLNHNMAMGHGCFTYKLEKWVITRVFR